MTSEMKISAQLIERWAVGLEASWGGAAAASVRQATARFGDGGPLSEVLGSVADDAARTGVPLDNLYDWVEQLTAMSRRVRSAARAGTLWAAIAERWTSAFSARPEAPSGLASFDVLRARLHRHYELCARLGAAADDTVVLVVVSATPADSAWAASATRRLLPHALTIVGAPNGRIIALVEREAMTTTGIDMIVAEARADGRSGLQVRTEPLAADVILLDAHLDQLERTG